MTKPEVEAPKVEQRFEPCKINTDVEAILSGRIPGAPKADDKAFVVDYKLPPPSIPNQF